MRLPSVNYRGYCIWTVLESNLGDYVYFDFWDVALIWFEIGHLYVNFGNENDMDRNEIDVLISTKILDVNILNV